MDDLTDDELCARLRWAIGERHLEPFVEPLRELQNHRAAQTASAEHAAMMLLDGLTGQRSANVFEAARNVEAVIAGIPGRHAVQEPSARGRDLHDAAAALVEAFMAGAAYVHDHSDIDDDGRIALERGANVERAAEQHVCDHEGESKVVQGTATASEVTDHRRTASAEQVRAVVREAINYDDRLSGHPSIADIADRVAAHLTSPPADHIRAAVTAACDSVLPQHVLRTSVATYRHRIVEEIANATMAQLGAPAFDLAERLATAESQVAALTMRRDELLALVAKVIRETPYPAELDECRSAWSALIAEVGTLRAKCDELTTDRDRLHKDRLP